MKRKNLLFVFMIGMLSMILNSCSLENDEPNKKEKNVSLISISVTTKPSKDTYLIG